MAIMFGSLRHTTSGRRKKKLPTPLKETRKFEKYIPENTYRREVKEYQSVTTDVAVAALPDRSVQIEVSSKFTIAPAYNKGAYQVISNSNVEDIGK